MAPLHSASCRNDVPGVLAALNNGAAVDIKDEVRACVTFVDASGTAFPVSMLSSLSGTRNIVGDAI